MDTLSKWDLLYPSNEETEEFRLPHGRRSGTGMRTMAIQEKISEALDGFDEDKMTVAEIRLLAIVQAMFDIMEMKNG